MIKSGSDPMLIDPKILDLSFKSTKRNQNMNQRKKTLLSYRYGINPREKVEMLQEILGKQYIDLTSLMMTDEIIDEDDIFNTKRRPLSANDINNTNTISGVIETVEYTSTSVEPAMTDSLVGSISIDSTGLKTNGERGIHSSGSLGEPNYTIKPPGSANLDLYMLREGSISKTGVRSMHRPRTDSPGNTTIIDHLLDSYLREDSVDVERFNDDEDGEERVHNMERESVMSAGGMSDINDLVDSIMGDARINKDIGSVSIEKSDVVVAELDLDEMPDELLGNWPGENNGVIQSYSPNRSHSSIGSSEISLLSYIGRLPPLDTPEHSSPFKPIIRHVFDDDIDSSCVDSAVIDEEFRLISQKSATEYVTIKVDPNRYNKKNVVQEPSPVYLDGKGTIKPLSELDQIDAAKNSFLMTNDSAPRLGRSSHNIPSSSRGSDVSEEVENDAENCVENSVSFEEVGDVEYEDEEIVPHMIDVKKLREEFKRQYLLALERQAKVKLNAEVLSYEKPETKVEMSAAQRAKLIGDKNKEMDDQKRLKDLKAKEKRRRKKKGKRAEPGHNKITIAYCVGGPGNIGVSSSHKVSLLLSPLKNISKIIQLEEDKSLRSSSPKRKEISLLEHKLPFK